ncbi:nitrous oxide reductase accessory protein NosL [Flavihumibacter sp. CACIAM 22H1]|uniref:nitrous oxide reductase accessory protein NosL n=1 Tax=Flavihumibacter sp. CACIAM 22H1 TaxID=1812911 RepID=UPI000A471FC6|nr:nitrous oxide reductase accessory protein NosL [Flavihumibacter sp. CACIAM 22H1]
MKSSLAPSTRIISLVTAIAVGLVFFLPIWRIDLIAPQYPEGLYLQIYAAKLGGDVDVINGLNHYIGMNHIHEKDFVEFQVLPYLILVLAGFGLLTTIINRKWFYFTWFGCLLAFGVLAMVDFYRWLYNYGHNLDPSAAIKVPGQSYQPPLIGYKQLLNFGAYSMPDTGGWIFIGAGLLLVIGAWVEIKRSRKAGTSYTFLFPLLTIPFLLKGCSASPETIPYGKQSCQYCKMTLLEKQFGTELVAATGKAYFFDDITCLQAYIREGQPGSSGNYQVFMSDYKNADKLLNLNQAFLYKSPELKGPMGGTIAAFESEQARTEFSKTKPGQNSSWKEQLQP